MTQMPKVSDFLHGAGGGGKGSAKNDKNTLRSNATVRFVALLSDGEIVGPTRGAKDIILDETRLQADNDHMNFQGVQWDFRSGLPDQSPFPNFRGVEQEQTVGVEVTKNNPVTRTLTDPDFTHCRVTIRIPALFKQTDKGMKRTSVQFMIEVRSYGGSYVNPFGVITLSGKNTSGYDKSYLIELPQAVAPSVSYPWEVRVTRITNDAEDNTKTQDMVYFASLTGIIDEQFIYPDSALLAMAINAEEFDQGLPTLSVEGDGAIIKVPSNYDPVNRTYSGIWNGTFKEAYTDNPAWIYYDVVTNKRVGMGNYIPEGSVDKWTLYEIGAYCDQLVPDGFGGMEPRFRMAAYLTEAKECYELLQLIASAFRGMSFWSSGSVTAVQDRPSDPVQLVTRANVVDGEFVYSSSSHTARHTVAHVRYMDPNDLYKSAVEVVRDPQAILRYGERVKEVNAFGCTSRGQARRLGMWILQSELYETQTVTYRAGMDHASLKPGDDILIMDERISGVDNGGRLKKVNSLASVTLDREVTLKAGATYSLFVMMPDGSVASRAVTNGAGKHSTLSLAAGLPQQPVAAAVWVLSASDVAPRPFRVLANTEKDDHIFEITALQKHVPKYEFVDHSARFDAPSYREERELTPPTNLRAREYSYFINGVPKVGITVSWEGDPKNLASVFRVEIESPNDQDRFTYPRVSGYSVDIEDVVPGVYTIRVYTLGVSNGRSDPTTLMFDARGWGEIAVPEVRNLRLVRPFTTPDCEIVWDNYFPGGLANNPMYKNNKVQVFGVTDQGPVLRREEFIYEQRYNYTIDKNRADGTPARRLLFRVTATYHVADMDVTSTENELTAYNAPIQPPVVEVASGFGQIIVSWSDTLDPDYVKTKVWVSRQPGFDINNTDPVYEGRIGMYPFVATDTDNRYIRVAHIDSFSDTDFLASSEVIGKALDVTIDVDPPATPTGLKLTSSLLDDEPGYVQLIATWDANTESDLAGYDVLIKEGSGNYVSYLTGENSFVWKVRPNVAFGARVAAFDKMNNKSAYSAEVEHTTAKDTTPPPVPTDLQAFAGLDAIWLKWDLGVRVPDFSHTEVWENSADDSSTATQIAVSVSSSFARTGLALDEERFYWVKAVDTSGNASNFSVVAHARTGSIPDVDLPTVEGLTFEPGTGAGNRLSWTTGTITYAGGAESRVVDAGFIDWLSGTVYVFYSRGNTALSATTSLATVYASNGIVLGIYKGGTDFQLVQGRAFMDGGMILAQTIGANQLVTDQAVITGTAQIKDAIISDAKIVDLDAVKLTANSIESNNVLVGLVNGANTLIEPGRIMISGDTTLNDWRSGGDGTEINGGKISANSVRATSLTIGQRGIDIIDIQFEHNSPGMNKVSWTAGAIAYIGDDGNHVTSAISAGTATYTNDTLYLYWVKNDATLSATTDISLAQTNNTVILATYQGGTRLVVAYGRTVIDGDHIKTGTITAVQADIESFRSNILTAGAIKADMLDAGIITSDKMAIGVSGNWLLNTDHRQGTLGYTGWSSVAPYALDLDKGAWSPSTGALHLHQDNGNTSAFGGIYPADKFGRVVFPVVPAQRVQLSAYVAAHRCLAGLSLHFRDKNGAELSAVSTPLQAVGTGADKSLSNYTRLHQFVTVPADAVDCWPEFVKGATEPGQTDSHMWVTRMYLGEASSGQTEPTPWSGSTPTIINGGSIETKSIKAESIDVDKLSALSAVLGEVDIDAAYIKYGYIDVARIRDLTVDTIKIKNGAISAAAVTASNNSDEITGDPGVWYDVLQLIVFNPMVFPVFLAGVINIQHKDISPAAWRITRDGVTVTEGRSTTGNTNTAPVPNPVNFIDDQAPAGTLVYMAQIKRSFPNTNVFKGYTRLTAVAFKK